MDSAAITTEAPTTTRTKKERKGKGDPSAQTETVNDSTTNQQLNSTTETTKRGTPVVPEETQPEVTATEVRRSSRTVEQSKAETTTTESAKKTSPQTTDQTNTAPLSMDQNKTTTQSMEQTKTTTQTMDQTKTTTQTMDQTNPKMLDTEQTATDEQNEIPFQKAVELQAFYISEKKPWQSSNDNYYEALHMVSQERAMQ
eukprot:GHVR01179855.1.p1 GENE.GHVR01179855.1~~GHVR01179855.1.p1  ORF type:complete len:199 (+),score=27.70 GHVR01179855.1:67-663(+)